MFRSKEIMQALLGVLFWAVVGLMWFVLIRNNEVSWDAAFSSTKMIGAMALVTLILMALWIRHNLHIYESKGPRRGQPNFKPRTDIDKLGRKVVWDDGLEANLQSNYVAIDILGEIKRYRPMDREE